MTELKDLQIRKEGDAWVVVYERVEDGAIRYDKFGPFASEAVANRRFMQCLCLYLLDAPEDVKSKNAGLLAGIEQAVREYLLDTPEDVRSKEERSAK